MTRKALTAIAAAFFLMIPLVAVAGPGFGPGPGDGPGFGPDGRGPGGGPLRHLLPPPGYLDLTEEQQETAQGILDGVREQLMAQHDQHLAVREELQALLDSETPDPTEVGRLVIQLHQGRESFRAVLEQAEADFAAILTAEQLEKWENWKELRDERRQRFGRRGGGRFGGFGPGPGPGAPTGE
jgi:Spy/CpxP family protein refolding chaperone